MNTEIVKPNLNNFIKSLRDVGYTFEIAVADILDNSITANASNIEIYAVPEPEIIFSVLDDGDGMSEKELVEAMRMATKDPDLERNKNDLGRFGLGLKTASFSQCKKLTVISKKDNVIYSREWNLDFISENNEWLLISPEEENIEKLPLLEKLKSQDSGTLVVWQNVDRYKKNDFTNEIDKLRKHLALVFHRFLEGADSFFKLKISINNNQLRAFNPFNSNHTATQVGSVEKIKIFDSMISIQPFVLPHHSKLSQEEYEQYATEEGYTKSQGFYLYRANRLLIYGTWWGLHKAIDAHKLVRIKIDISNDQDKYWGIDIKKSTAKPVGVIKSDLKRIIQQVTQKGARTYTGRAKNLEDKTTKRFWNIVPLVNNDFRFAINLEHPLYLQILNSAFDKELLNIFLKGLEAYLPLETIQAHLQQNPQNIKQETALSEEEIIQLVEKLKASGLAQEYIEDLLKTELFRKRKELLGIE